MTKDIVDVSKKEYMALNDLVERLVERAGINRSEGSNKLVTRAIQDTIRALPNKHEWSYFQRTIRFVSSASVAFTADYDYTGGASERLLTITSAETFPSDADSGEIFFNSMWYKVERRISSTTVSLRADSCPVEDFTGQSIVWARSTYPLPRRMTRVHTLVCRDEGIVPLFYLPPQDFFASIMLNWGSVGGPIRYTIQPDGLSGETGVVLSPPPSAARTFEANVTVSPAIPTVLKIAGDDGAISSGTNVFTSATASFNDRILGSMLRISVDSAVPDQYGAAFKAFVTRVISPTSVELSEYCPTSYSGKVYLISSPIDIDSDSMLNYVEAESFAQFCRNHKHESLQLAQTVAAQDLREAIIADQRTNKIRVFDPYRYWPGDFGYWTARTIIPV